MRGRAGPAGADPPEFAPAIKPRRFFATPSYLRLWFAGGIGNAMRWLELLVAGIFTYEATQSTVMVALVTVARSLPMLFIGTIAGVVGEALNRRRLLVTQLFVIAVTSAALCGLAVSAEIRVWHIALGGIVAGIVWAMELAVRRRMIGEVVAPDQVAPAVAFDSAKASKAECCTPRITTSMICCNLGAAGKLRDTRNRMTDKGARERARERSEAYRKRRRHGRVSVPIEIGPHQLAALERLALLGVGDRDKVAIAGAVTRFLDAAPHLSALGDALWPESEERNDQVI